MHAFTDQASMERETISAGMGPEAPCTVQTEKKTSAYGKPVPWTRKVYPNVQGQSWTEWYILFVAFVPVRVFRELAPTV